MRNIKIDVTLPLETLTCITTQCGIVWAVPSVWHARRRQDHGDMYCPNGHKQGYYGETAQEKELKRLNRDLAEMTRSHTYEHDRRLRAEEDAMTLANSNRALKGVATKLKARVAAGVCPFCHRTIKQMARHIASKHSAHEEAAHEPAR